AKEPVPETGGVCGADRVGQIEADAPPEVVAQVVDPCHRPALEIRLHHGLELRQGEGRHLQAAERHVDQSDPVHDAFLLRRPRSTYETATLTDYGKKWNQGTGMP